MTAPVRLADRGQTTRAPTAPATPDAEQGPAWVALPSWYRTFRAGYLAVAVVGLIAYVVLADRDLGPGVLREVTYQGLEVLAVAACLLRAAVVPARRVAWLALGLGIAAWTIADLVFILVLEPQGEIPYPSIGDALYFIFYATCFVAIAVFAKDRRMGFGFSLDALIGILSIATVWTAIFPSGLFETSGSTAAVATNLAYPLFDVLLLAMVTVALTKNHWRLGAGMALFVSALLVLAVADTIYLVQVARDTYEAGHPPDALWPAALLMVGLAAWTPTAIAPGPRRALGEYLFPGTCALIALAFLVWDHFERAGLATVILAAAVIAVSTVRGGRLFVARERAAREAEEAVRRTVGALALSVDAKDAYTANHSERVTMYAIAIGVEIGLSPATLERLSTAAQLHDLGKLAIPDTVLLKPDRLTPEEFAVMKTHSEAGERIISRAGMHDVALIVRHHHERCDGRGYPDGLEGEQIPFESRIVAVADALDAMTSDRSYSRSITPLEARAELEHNTGSQFDARVAEVTIALIDRGVIRPEESPPVCSP